LLAHATSAALKSGPSRHPRELESSSAPAVRQRCKATKRGHYPHRRPPVRRGLDSSVRIGDHLIGALTLGSEIGNSTAQELHESTSARFVLLANGRVIASTVPNPEPPRNFGKVVQRLRRIGGRRRRAAPLRKLSLGGEHYFYTAGKFSSLNGQATSATSCSQLTERSLGALHSTQQTLLFVSLLGILLGSAIVCSSSARPRSRCVSCATAPDGRRPRGDFSRRSKSIRRRMWRIGNGVQSHDWKTLKTRANSWRLTSKRSDDSSAVIQSGSFQASRICLRRGA